MNIEKTLYPDTDNRISACIITGNEEKNIRRCLDSVSWVDEIIVVDSFSTDKTAIISREYTQKVYQHEWLGYIGQRNLIKAMATYPWILFVDADEELSQELRIEIENEFASGSNKNYAAYEFPRMVKFLGRWIMHGNWYPDIKLRLFRKDLGTCSGKEPHDLTIVNGPKKRLKGHLYHYTYDDIASEINSLNRFSSISADGKFEDNVSFKMFDLFFRPTFRFVRGYFLKLGFLNGMPGLIIEVSTAYGVFVKYAKLWERYNLAKEKK
ncbi:MAG: glycosyltransferase family 2 protein [Kiritimatiellae bacterium]|jgi:glycosyltransferase involved in cell wall biosynthesis|nr:glycosyltransferase family 2 protein [Kiritimatiellia bacterium]